MERVRERQAVRLREHDRVQPLHPVVQHQHEPLGRPVRVQAAQVPRQPVLKPDVCVALPRRLARLPLGLLRLFRLRVLSYVLRKRRKDDRGAGKKRMTAD